MSSTNIFEVTSTGKKKGIEKLYISSKLEEGGASIQSVPVTDPISSLNLISSTLDIGVTPGSANVSINIPRPTTIQTAGPVGTKSLVYGKTGPNLLIKGVTGKNGINVIDNTTHLTIESKKKIQTVQVPHKESIVLSGNTPTMLLKGLTGAGGLKIKNQNQCLVFDSQVTLKSDCPLQSASIVSNQSGPCLRVKGVTGDCSTTVNDLGNKLMFSHTPAWKFIKYSNTNLDNSHTGSTGLDNFTWLTPETYHLVGKLNNPITTHSTQSDQNRFMSNYSGIIEYYGPNTQPKPFRVTCTIGLDIDNTDYGIAGNKIIFALKKGNALFPNSGLDEVEPVGNILPNAPDNIVSNYVTSTQNYGSINRNTSYHTTLDGIMMLGRGDEVGLYICNNMGNVNPPDITTKITAFSMTIVQV